MSYQDKIKTLEELQEIIGSHPRDKKVIMCHGTFDLVHPGHIRHLMYAKNKADILIVSLTGDAFVTKADYRPFIPEDLRAINLAALECVDYVIVDYSPTPEENIITLKPDYFAKGYEYSDQTNLKNQIERAAVDSYNGEFIYTPGDIVYSSSEIINNGPPNLAIEKLITLMKSNNITFDDLESTIHKFKDLKVHIIGDTIVDVYIYCNPQVSGMAKTPTISTMFDHQKQFVGGAAIVAKHLKSAGAKIIFSTVMGDDELCTFVTNDICHRGISFNCNVDKDRITTEKQVFISNDYRLLKVDKVDNRPISERTLERLCESITGTEADAYVFSDFRHGIFNRDTIPKLINCLPTQGLRVADSQVASRWGNILEFKEFDLITPNEREARFALADQDSVIRPLALELYKLAQCKTLILKLGNKGTLTYRAPSDSSGSFFSLDALAENVIDPVGAGDALLAYSTLALALDKNIPVTASILGSVAAAIACETDGNNPVSPESVVKKLNNIRSYI
jgi:rfaE bifunctional protein kinase chain/domain